MAKKSASSRAYPGGLSYVGEHIECGGSVFYRSTASMGWSYCQKCGHNGMYGTPTPEVVKQNNP